MFKRNGLRDHIADRFDGYSITPFPTPHLIIPDFFPQSVYQQILDFNPFRTNRGEDWLSATAMRKNRQSTPYNHRKQIEFEKGDYTAEPEVKEFWDELTATFL